jgi:hypothetical protein
MKKERLPIVYLKILCTSRKKNEKKKPKSAVFEECPIGRYIYVIWYDSSFLFCHDSSFIYELIPSLLLGEISGM